MNPFSSRPICRLFLFLCLNLPPTVWGQTDNVLVFDSGREQTIFIELFTSQGCSSCPPAEKWLNALARHPDLWNEIIPVAFHVDYWDKLGWRDSYASGSHTRRQYQYRSENRIHSVYTPCFLINGKEWRGWLSGYKLPQSRSQVRPSLCKTGIRSNGNRLFRKAPAP